MRGLGLVVAGSLHRPSDQLALEPIDPRAQGEIIEHADGQWWARVHSENWRVRSEAHLRRGQRVRVTGRDGLLLTVEPEGKQAEGD